MQILKNVFFAVLFSTLAFCQVVSAEEKTLGPAQKAFLENHTSPGLMMGSFDSDASWSFDSYASYLYAVHSVMIHTYQDDINSTQIHFTFKPTDKPTWREIFDSVAKQTGSKWSYDAEHNYWVFSKGPTTPPFTISIAPGWKSEYRGNYVSYHPTIAPVGMDIYFEEIPGAKNHISDTALMWAKRINPNAKSSEISKKKVADYEALYYSTVVPSTGIHWRHWALAAGDKEFVIVSAIEPEKEKIILPDVETMIQTFKAVASPAS